ncbi:MAG: GGDEF domain-containing protein [Sideroxydans sp.]|nr:GGDEF domain-containing protein [Sideroxydans sp.]
MQPLKEFLNSLALRLLGNFSGNVLNCVVTTSAHPPLLSRYRAQMIISRVRLVSALFAVLTPLWIAVDYLAFDYPLSLMLGIGRIATTAAFAALALAYQGSPHMRDAYRSLGIMFVIPTAFFIYSHQILSSFDNQGGAAIIAAGYAFLPFILVAGLSVFPLTALEGIVFSLPVLSSSALVATLHLDQMSWNTHIGAFWLLVLIAATATLAGMSQLALMAALVRQAHHDPLTHCFNRASGEEIFKLQFSIAERNGNPLTIIFIDLDNFKSVNDQYGHHLGDRVLIGAVDAIRGSLRGGDALVRWGGEEFLMVLPNTNYSSAIALLERLRGNGLGLRPDGNSVTASYGIAERTLDSADNSQLLIEIADQRMYQAKNSGKDRWVGCNETAHFATPHQTERGMPDDMALSSLS